MAVPACFVWSRWVGAKMRDQTAGLYLARRAVPQHKQFVYRANIACCRSGRAALEVCLKQYIFCES